MKISIKVILLLFCAVSVIAKSINNDNSPIKKLSKEDSEEKISK